MLLEAVMAGLNGPLPCGDLARTLERAGDGAFLIRGGGRIVLRNPRAEKILGDDAHDVLGKPCSEIVAGTWIRHERP